MPGWGKEGCQGNHVALWALLSINNSCKMDEWTQWTWEQSSHKTYHWLGRRKLQFHWPLLGQSAFYRCQEDHTAGFHVEAEDKGNRLRWWASIWMLKQLHSETVCIWLNPVQNCDANLCNSCHPSTAINTFTTLHDTQTKSLPVTDSTDSKHHSTSCQ